MSWSGSFTSVLTQSQEREMELKNSLNLRVGPTVFPAMWETEDVMLAENY